MVHYATALIPHAAGAHSSGVKYLLKRSEVNRLAPPTVFVVNNHPKKKAAEKREEEKRYLRLFNDPRRMHYTTLSFEDFARRGMASLGTP